MNTTATASEHRVTSLLPARPSTAQGRFWRWCQPYRGWLLLMGVCALTYFIGMHRLPMTDPDEVFYAETAKEMLANRSFLTPLIFERPQFEKPPLFYWLLMLSTTCFGMNVVAIRLVPGLCGLLGALATYAFVKRAVNERAALYSALILSTGVLYLGLSRGVLTDITFTVLIAMTQYSFYTWYRSGRSIWLMGFAAAAALAVLTKGPLGFVIPLLTALMFLAIKKDLARYRAFVRHPGWIVLLALALPWYVYTWKTHGQAFIGEFFVHDHWHRLLRAEHRKFDHWYFYPFTIVAGMFPWTGFLKTLTIRPQPHHTERLFLWCWITVVLISFGVAHSKLMSYILPLFPALSILLGLSLDTAVDRRHHMPVLGIVTLTLGLIAIVVPWILPRFVPPQYAAWINPAALAPSLAVFALIMIGVGVLLLKRQLHRAVVLNAVGCGGIAATLFLTMPSSLMHGVTSVELPQLIASSGYTDEILCSKQFARGVYFYTHHPVVVLDTSPQPFWSPHPLEILDRDQELTNYFRRKTRVLSVIEPEDLERLQNIAGKPWRHTVMSENAQRMFVMSERTNRSLGSRKL